MTLLRPISQNKFRAIFKNFGWPGAETLILTQQMRKVTLPNIKADNTVHPGLHIEFQDEVTNGVMKLLLTQLARQRDQLNTSEFQIDLELLDDNQKPLRTHAFSGCLLGGIVQDPLSYEERESMGISTLASYRKFEIFDADRNKLW